MFFNWTDTSRFCSVSTTSPNSKSFLNFSPNVINVEVIKVIKLEKRFPWAGTSVRHVLSGQSFSFYRSTNFSFLFCLPWLLTGKTERDIKFPHDSIDGDEWEWLSILEIFPAFRFVFFLNFEGFYKKKYTYRHWLMLKRLNTEWNIEECFSLIF